jgi:hypothetical protein
MLKSAFKKGRSKHKGAPSRPLVVPLARRTAGRSKLADLSGALPMDDDSSSGMEPPDEKRLNDEATTKRLEKNAKAADDRKRARADSKKKKRKAKKVASKAASKSASKAGSKAGSKATSKAGSKAGSKAASKASKKRSAQTLLFAQSLRTQLGRSSSEYRPPGMGFIHSFIHSSIFSYVMHAIYCI